MQKISSCRICGSTQLISFFDLGCHPFSNSLLPTKESPDYRFPLSLSRCSSCSLIQLNETANPKELFSKYFWVTGTSKETKIWAEHFYNEAVSRMAHSENMFVMEIASNDGTFLEPFKNNGYKVQGIDPAGNIAEMAEKRGIPTFCEFFSSDYALKFIAENSKADFIFVRNALPHVANTLDFVKGLSVCMKDEGLLAIEFHYSKQILEGLQYDSIYHEHLCYFSLYSISMLFKKFNLFIQDVIPSPLCGGSLVVFFRKIPIISTQSVTNLLKIEKELGVNALERWEKFAKQATLHREEFRKVLTDIKSSGAIIAGYGASARSSTLLNFCQVNKNLISCIADQNSLKHNHLTAGTHIPIVSPEEMLTKKPSCVVILAWNFYQEIVRNLRDIYKFKGKIIVPLPDSPRFISEEEIDKI